MRILQIDNAVPVPDNFAINPHVDNHGSEYRPNVPRPNLRNRYLYAYGRDGGTHGNYGRIPRRLFESSKGVEPDEDSKPDNFNRQHISNYYSFYSGYC
jgi:hypothetical protein